MKRSPVRSLVRAAVPAMMAMLPGCVAGNAAEPCGVSRLAEIPVRMDRGIITVHATINDRAVRLIVDTGATHTVLSDDTAARIGVAFDPNATASATGAAGQTAGRVTRPVAVTVGGFRLSPTSIITIPSAAMLNLGVDGVLGVEPLANYDLDIDLRKRSIGLYEPRRCPDGPAPFDGPSRVYKTAPNPDRFLYMPARVDGRALSLVIDTGSSRTFLNTGWVAASEKSVAADQPVHATAVGPGNSSARLHRFASVVLGGVVMRDTTLAIETLPDMDGLLGNDFWTNRRVWLSFASGTATAQSLPTD